MSTPQVEAALPEETKVEKKSGAVSRWRQLLAQRELGIFLVVLVGAIFLHFASGNFASKANLIALVLGLSFDAIVAVGMTVLLVSGQFDLA